MTLSQIIFWSIAATILVTIILAFMWWKQIYIFSLTPGQQSKLSLTFWGSSLAVELVALLTYFLVFALITQPETTNVARDASGSYEGEQNYQGLESFYGPGTAKTIVYLLNDIDNTKDNVDSQQNAVWYALTTAKISLIILSALSTAMVAISNRTGYERIAPWIIVPTTLVTIISGIDAYYDYSGQHSRLSELRSALAELQGRIIFDINLDVASSEDKIMAQKKPDEYLRLSYTDLNTILSRYEQGRPLKEPPQVMTTTTPQQGPNQ
jgi:hypothetical protein